MSVKFYKNTDRALVAGRIAETINKKLGQGKKVVWLLSGGSAINIAVLAASLINKADSQKLTIGLIDERYGPPGHDDSNWRQLLSAGLDAGRAQLHPVLAGKSLVETTAEYDEFIKSLANEDVYRIGLLGIGADGHTAGILPDCPVLKSTTFVDYYAGPDYQRITLTGKGLLALDKAVVFAAGDQKRAVIEALSGSLPVRVQPAQLLKEISDVDIYNNAKGEVI